MDNKFNCLPWHDAELLKINIDRSDAGNRDTIIVNVRWSDGRKNNIVFNDCYLLEAKMNFGLIVEEHILCATCLEENQSISDIKSKWSSLGVVLDNIKCYRIITNSTNSQIDIYALSFTLS